MKKFAAIALSALMAVSTAAVSLSSVSAASTTAFGSGNGTINVYKNIASPGTTGGLANAGFTAYKVMSYEGTSLNQYFSFTTPYASNTDVTTWAAANLTPVTGQANQYVTYGDTDTFEAFIATLEGVANTSTASEEVKTDEDGKASFTNLDKGVYLIKETSVPTDYSKVSQSYLVAILENNQVVNTYPKNQKMEVDKDFITDTAYAAATPAASTEGDKANASIGDTVSYQIKTQVPNYDNRIVDAIADKSAVTVIKVGDTLSSGLTLDQNSIKVYAGNTDITSAATITKSAQTFEVTLMLDDVYTNATTHYLGQNLYVEYQATVNENAVVTTGNANDAKISYENDPTNTSDPLTDVSVPNEKKPILYTYELQLTKLLDGEAVTGTPSVADLTFVLKQGDKYVKVSGSNGVYKVVSDHEDAATDTALKLKTTDGTLTVTGLDAGTYTLTESGSVTGYTTLASPLTIVVSEYDANNNGYVKATVNGANVDTVQTDVPNPAYDVVKATAEEGDEFYDPLYDKTTPETIKQNTGAFKFEINNPKNQFDLPTTGGYGILIFTLGGAVVLAAAIIIFVAARKKKTDK